MVVKYTIWWLVRASEVWECIVMFLELYHDSAVDGWFPWGSTLKCTLRFHCDDICLVILCVAPPVCLSMCVDVGVCLCAHLNYNNVCMLSIYMYALCALVVPCMCVVCRSSAAPVPPPQQLWCGGGGSVPQLEGRHHSGLPWQREGTLPFEGGRGEQASYPPSPYFRSHFCS